MLYTKYGNNWHCSFHEEVKNGELLTNDGRRTTHDDRRSPIATGHLSDSDDLKTLKNKQASRINILLQMSKK